MLSTYSPLAENLLTLQGWTFYGIREKSLGKSSPILGSGEEFAETQLRVCCRDLTGEVLNTGRENFSEGKLIYFIQTEGKGKGEDDLCLA